MGRSACMVFAMALTFSAPALVAAQDEDEESEATESEDEAPPDEADPEAGDDSEEAGAEPAADEAVAAASSDEQRKFYFGLYLRYNIVPSFILRMFLDEAPTVSNFAPGGVALNIWNPSDGGPSFQIGIGYSSYAFDGPFRETGGPAVDTEYLHSTLGLVHLTGSVLWNTPIIEKVLWFEYGLGLDFGIVTGSLIRTEARFDTFSNSYVPCTSKNDLADPLHTYCGFPSPPTLETNTTDMDGEHYHVKANVPPVFALPLLPQLALRYEPMNGLAFKFETGLFPVFWLGLSAAYAPF